MPAGEDGGYGEFIATVDTSVFGKASFDTVLTFDAWPDGTLHVHVLSRQEVIVPDELRTTVSSSAESPSELVAPLHRSDARRNYIDGGMTIRSFLACGLIDDRTLTVIPVPVGSGRPLFGQGSTDTAMTLEFVRTMPNGFVQLRYRVARY